MDDRGSISKSGHRVHTDSGAHSVAYQVYTSDSFPKDKFPGREADHSPPCSVKDGNSWSYTSTPPHDFIAWNLIKHTNDII
jgi:hypothetical protein